MWTRGQRKRMRWIASGGVGDGVDIAGEERVGC